jgi:hypothetical protein
MTTKPPDLVQQTVAAIDAEIRRLSDLRKQLVPLVRRP